MLPELRTEIPGPLSREWAAKLRQHESRNVTYVDPEYPVFWQRAEGVNVWDVDGNRFLDWISGFGVAGLGHTNPAVRDALISQAQHLIHAMGDVHPTPLKAEICAKLSALTFERWGVGPGKVILGNSGFEAVEAALKTVFLRTGKPGVIAFEGAYHGLGYGTLEVVGTNYFRAPFRRQLKEFATLLPYPKIRFSSETEDFPECPPELLENLEHQIEQAAQTREIGCVLVEPIQGRGGEIIPPIGFLQMLRSVCNRLGLVLILDEIYTGLNRTGALFACEHFGVIPDIICLGKGLTSGFPLSACVGKAEIMDAWPESTGEALHTSTFLGNPLGCAMALASLEQHANPETATEVRRTGTKVKRAFQQIQSQHVVEVRGIGLLIGVELTLDGLQTNQLVKRALRDGMIWLQSGPAGNVLVFAPPFAMAEEEIAFTATRLQEYLTSLFGSIS